MTALLLLLTVACQPPATPATPTAPPETAAAAAPADPAVLPGVRPTAPAAVAYVVRFPQPAAHEVEVEATFTADGPVTWMMPVWTPGSYLVREYARHVETIAAVDAAGAPVAVTKVAKNRWTVGGAGPRTLRWTLYAREASVRGNLVDADVGVLNGAATFLVPADRLDAPLELTVEPPAAWPDLDTALAPHPDGRPRRFLAPDYDTLVDSPIVLGRLTTRTFAVDEVPHRVVLLGDVDRLDADRLAEDAQRVVAAQSAFWGGLPYDSYRFLHLVGYGRGGLEHRDSTLVMSADVLAKDDEAWWSLLGLYSHELFHAWNVKRLRPAGLGPFDYEREVLVPTLWVAEGLTAYYDDLLLARAGLLTPVEHVERLGEALKDAVDRPGAAVQPLSQAGVDAWIKFYRGDEQSPNATVNYYTKGAAVGWLLDVEIRRRTDDRASLDDVLRLLWSRHADADGYTPADVRAAATEVAGAPLDAFFDAYVDGTAPLDLAPALAWYGLRWKPADASTPAKGWLGLTHDAALVVTQVRDGTPAADGDLDVGDELLAIDGRRVTAASIADEVGRLEPGTSVEVTVARRSRLRTLTLPVRAAPAETWKLELDPEAPTAAELRRRRWHGPR